MRRSNTGRYAISTSGSDRVRAFIPAPLPPIPAIEIAGSVQKSLDLALLALGRLDGAAATLPDARLLLYTYIRKEAVLSSQIEGTQSTLNDLLAHELGEVSGVPLSDVAEVSRYVEATTYGLERLRNGCPLSNRLLREMHGILLAEGRGAQKTPGEFRRSQNWIGGTRPGDAAFVPPPPQEVESCMGDLEGFLHSNTPALLKAALAHLQFETIHPFLDGNGRIGRLLITLLLCHEGVLREPLLYSSLYFKQHRQQYYSELNAVRGTGDFERWLNFFSTAIRASAEQATKTALHIFAVFQEDRSRARELGRQAPTALLIQEALQANPMATIAGLTEATGLSTPTVTQALRALEGLNIVQETTGRARGRIFAYRRYLDALNSEEQNLYTRSKELVGDRNPREEEFSIQMRAMDSDKAGAGVGLPVLVALCGALLNKNTRGGTVVVGALNLGGSVELIPNAVRIVELAIDKQAQTILMPVAVRRQLNDLPDELWTKISIEFYKDSADAVFKALVE